MIEILAVISFAMPSVFAAFAIYKMINE